MEVDLSLPDESNSSEKNFTLHDVHTSLDSIDSWQGEYSGIVGEHVNRLAVFTHWILGRRHVILRGASSSGKTNLMLTVASFADNPMQVAASSDKAYRRENNIKNASHIVIPEINKINESTQEMIKDFGEGRASQYSFLDDYNDKKTVLIEPKPFITSIADENPNELQKELLTRVTTIHMDSSVEQNKKVIEHKLESAKNPFDEQEMSESEIEDLKSYVYDLPSSEDLEFIFLPGESVMDSIPPIFTQSRRDVKKYLENIYGITTFHYPNRVSFKKDGQEFVLVTPQDVYLNDVIFKEILLKSSLECSEDQRIILKILSTNGKNQDTLISEKTEEHTVDEIRDAFMDRGLNYSVSTVRKKVNDLYETGYVSRNDETKPYTYEINKDFMQNWKVSLDWREIVKTCKENVHEIDEIPDEKVTEYIEHCTDPVVTHPITGEQVYMIDQTEEQEELDQETEEESSLMDDGVLTERSEETEVRDKVLKELREYNSMDVSELISTIGESVSVGTDFIERQLDFLEKRGDIDMNQGEVTILE